MKIEGQPQTPIPAPTQTTRKSQPKHGEKTTPRTKAKEAVDSQGMQLRITQWFAKAGIAPINGSGWDVEVDKRLRRHQRIKAQQRMHNLERILDLALDFSLESGRQENIDADWFFSFVALAENIHSSAMQELWAKIFAMEISRPGTFSLRTLKVLQDITHRDASMLRIAAGMVSRKKGESSPKLLFGYYQKPSAWQWFTTPHQHQLNLAQYGLAYPNLLSLMDLGLIYNSEIESAELDTGTRSEWRCGNESLHLTPRHRGIALNYYKFTPTGSELFNLLHSPANQPYLEGLKGLLAQAFEVN
ncbi:TIGR03899 family protein [Aestuariibacter halophilus]|uniref:TIGR03899 family protein n=1 Tax=Fluctibacter halophilus TaxID=226011 RepID=A0ABS8GCW9_9ALTE|nr:TIGR03899 family protein [Aestuariibacter halophilus]MCC2618244.1 TIGR03899 family protein [Aestuariibacter halophilus]